MRLPRLLAAASAIAALTPTIAAPGIARADLVDDVDTLTKKWLQKDGTTVDRLPPVFLEHGHMTVLRLTAPAATPALSATPAPAATPPPAAATTPAAPAAPLTPATPTKPFTTAAAATPAPPAPAPPHSACTTVVLLAPRTSEIAFLPDGTAARPLPLPPTGLPLGHAALAQEGAGPVRSKSGVAMLERCGKEQLAHPLEDERLLLQSVSPRTAVEVLVVRSRAPIDRVETLLPVRAEGPIAPRGDAGRPLDPGPLEGRLARAERRARDAGAERVVKLPMRASPAGTGTFVPRLAEGCHTLDLLADIPSTARRGTDLDAHAHTVEGARALARDRGESPDARLEFCLGEPTEVEIGFLGASGEVDVTLVDARWPLPAAIPTEWGPQVRGDIALALRRRHTPPLPPEPVTTFMGVQGETVVPLSVEPGHCYLAVAALVRGDVRALRLGVEIGDRAPHDEVADRPEAAQVTFCAPTEDRAALRIEARGTQPWWLALVWRLPP